MGYRFTIDAKSLISTGFSMNLGPKKTVIKAVYVHFLNKNSKHCSEPFILYASDP